MSYKQKDRIGRQKLVCIINLNSSYREKESIKCSVNNSSLLEKEDKNCSIVRKPLKLSSKCYRRVAPSCLRKKCFRKCVNSHKNVHHHRSRKYLRERRQPVNHQHDQNTDKLLSPISSSPLKDDVDLLYEDISTDSFERTMEKPLSYKHVNFCNRRNESKLDTLIRRTKERERKLVEQSRTKQWYTMSPRTFSNITSEECLCSNFSDVSTFILERNENQLPEPFNEVLETKTEEFNLISHPYSTSSPKEDLYPKIENYDFKIEEFKSEPIEKYEVKIGVKSEPVPDIGTYSPITNYYPTISIKWEPKIEPNVT